MDGLIVTPACDGGIFESNEKITVSGVLVQNTGALDLPNGVDLIKFESTHYEIPGDTLRAGQKSILSFEFCGHIQDFPPPEKPGRQVAAAEFYSRIELLGRTFQKSFYKQMILFSILSIWVDLFVQRT